MSHSCSKKIAIVLMKGNILIAIILGLLPPKYMNFKHTKLEKYYSVFSKLCFIVATVYFLLQISLLNQTSNATNNWILFIFNNSITLSTLIITIKHWFGRVKHDKLVVDVVKLRNDYFRNKDIENIFFARYVIVRSAVNFFQLLCGLFYVFTASQNNTIYIYLLALVLCFLQSVFFGIENQYFYGILYISCFYGTLNKDLVAVRTKLNAVATKKLYCELADEVDLIASIYRKLFHLEQRLTVLFEPQLILILSCKLIYNVASCFGLVVFFTDKFHSENKELITLEIVLLFGAMAVMWLNFNVCEYFSNNAVKVRETLKSFTELNVIDLRLARSLEMMAIQCSCVVPKVCIGGFFELNNKRCFQLLIYIVSTILVLVQYDYINLF